MIIVGYQGIGKSTVTKMTKGVLDLESSNTKVNGVRNDDWYIVYSQFAEDLSRQGNIVFISSHRVIREYLRQNSHEKLVIIAPSLKLKDEWIKKLQDRYNQSRLDKDKFALLNAQEKYEENLREMQDFKDVFDYYEIDRMDYSMFDFMLWLKGEIRFKPKGFTLLESEIDC